MVPLVTELTYAVKNVGHPVPPANEVNQKLYPHPHFWCHWSGSCGCGLEVTTIWMANVRETETCNQNCDVPS
jgi:hypothetical protein